MNRIIAIILCLAFVMAMVIGVNAEESTAAENDPLAMELALGETQTVAVDEDVVSCTLAASDENIIAIEGYNVTALNAGACTLSVTVAVTVMETVEKIVVDTVEKVVVDTVETTDANGEVTTKEVQKVVSEDVERVVTEEVEKTEEYVDVINVVVKSALCPGCGAEYTNAAEFEAHVQVPACGVEGHYVCDAIEDHETQLNEFCANENPHRVCQAGVATHDCASCGATYACEDSGSHTTCLACGNAWCFKDNGNHFTPACGKIEHRACVQENYNKKDHYRCDYCGDRLCDGDRHGKGKCD